VTGFRTVYVPTVSRAYLSQKLTRPLPTKDGGTLRTVLDARAYMLRLSKDRERSARCKGRLNCCLQRPILECSPSRLNWHFSLKPSLILRQWNNHRASSAITVLLLKRASASRPSGEWNDDDFDVLANQCDGANDGDTERESHDTLRSPHPPHPAAPVPDITSGNSCRRRLMGR
jgi:hypothetical protein